MLTEGKRAHATEEGIRKGIEEMRGKKEGSETG